MLAYDLMIGGDLDHRHRHRHAGPVRPAVLRVSILLGGGVVVLYSTIGGMWSLTLTDIVQFIIMTVGLMFLLMPMSINDAGGWDALVAKLPASYFDFTAIGWDTIVTYFLIYFFGILIGQDIWQRVFTARSENVARFAGLGRGRLLRALRHGRRADRHGRQGPAAGPGERQQRLRQRGRAQPAGRHPRPGDRRGPGGADVHRQRRPAGLVHHRAGGPAAAAMAGAQSVTAGWPPGASPRFSWAWSCWGSPWWSATCSAP